MFTAAHTVTGDSWVLWLAAIPMFILSVMSLNTLVRSLRKNSTKRFYLHLFGLSMPTIGFVTSAMLVFTHPELQLVAGPGISLGYLGQLYVILDGAIDQLPGR